MKRKKHAIKYAVKKVAPGVYEHSFTPVTEIHAFTLELEKDSSQELQELTEEDKVHFEILLDNAFSAAQERMYDGVVLHPDTKDIPVNGALYDQNYKSAVLDKNGKFVRKIE